MGTAKQLVSAFVDAPPIKWSWAYSKNMQEVRGYPNYWHIRNDIAYIDGPPQEGQTYTKDLYIWKAEIEKDSSGNNTNVINLYNLIEDLERTEQTVNGETVYYYKYSKSSPKLSYTHTDVVDNVSLEFDQNGRRLIAFESNSHIFLIWYDPVMRQTTITDFGEGFAPHIVTDTYRRTGGPADSERFLFYVSSSTNQIVYRRQNDRYGVEYALPSAPSDVVDLLKVSKNLYGGLTVVYCYESSGELEVGSFTARYAVDAVAIGTDGRLEDTVTMLPTSGSVTEFRLKIAGIPATASETAEMSVSSGAITNFELRSAQLYLDAEVDTVTMSPTSGTISSFTLKDILVTSEEIVDTSTMSVTSGTIPSFVLKEARIDINAEEDPVTMLVSSGTITSFTLG